MDIQGTTKVVGQTQDISSSFKKREIVVTTSEENYPQHILIEFTQDRCSLLDDIRIGDIVKVDINLRGREWQSPQGETRYFNTIQGWRITKATNQEQVQYQDQQGYMQNGQYHGQGSATQAYHNQQQANNFPPTTEEDSGLPF